MEALLAAYRVGARVSWREMSSSLLEDGVDAQTLAEFAGLVFAYIDQLSASMKETERDNVSTDESQSATHANLQGRLG